MTGNLVIDSSLIFSLLFLFPPLLFPLQMPLGLCLLQDQEASTFVFLLSDVATIGDSGLFAHSMSLNSSSLAIIFSGSISFFDPCDTFLFFLISDTTSSRLTCYKWHLPLETMLHPLYFFHGFYSVLGLDWSWTWAQDLFQPLSKASFRTQLSFSPNDNIKLDQKYVFNFNFIAICNWFKIFHSTLSTFCISSVYFFIYSFCSLLCNSQAAV